MRVVFPALSPSNNLTPILVIIMGRGDPLPVTGHSMCHSHIFKTAERETPPIVELPRLITFSECQGILHSGVIFSFSKLIRAIEKTTDKSDVKISVKIFTG